MRSTAAAILSLAVLAGLGACSAKTGAPKADAPAAASTAPAVVEAKRPAMPDCAKVEAVDGGDAGWRHPDCRLREDKADLNFDVRYSASVDDKDGKKTPVTIQISQAGDAILQTITEQMGNSFGAPSLQDIDGDGYMDLLVPLETGNVNTDYAIWLMPGGANQFIRVGQVSGVAFHKTQSGFIAAPARSSANEWAVQFFKLGDGPKLVPVLTADVTARGTPDKLTGIDCNIMDDGGIKDLKMAPKAVTAKFCAEPVVKDVFK